MMVNRVLAGLQEQYPEMNIHKIDVIANPIRTWNDGIRMIPALKAGNKILSGILPGKKRIRDFVDEVYGR